MATVEERERQLNAKCMECRKEYGEPSFEHCNYHCQTGFELHKLEFEKNNGWGNHDYWKKSH